ncbi:MAG: hypothetical protein LBU45_02935, partial [Azoarcus sp.]|nr:hypothetical protein [Azoarcus sp.]
EHDLANGPGIVSFISASSFINGDAFLGMRQHMRRLCDEIWVIDLGGEGRGTWRDDNVFAIQTPVAITIAVRYGDAKPKTPAKTHYARIGGARAAKLQKLENLQSFAGLDFEDCPKAWGAPFRPEGKGDYFAWLLLKDLMPWQHSGAQAKRTWPIGPTKKVLSERWRQLLSTPDRAEAFRESSDRTVAGEYPQFHPSNTDMTPIDALNPSAECPVPQPYGFRSFDRQFIIADGRLLSRPRSQLWQVYSGNQFYFASLFTQALGNGPALTVSAEVPDLHFFRGSFGAKNILPLYRDKSARQANLHPGLLPALVARYGTALTPEDFAAYLYGLLAQPAFTTRFYKELASRELRLPLTLDGALFKKLAGVGRELLYLHTCGERFAAGRSWPAPKVKCLKAVPAGRLPENFSYDETHKVVRVDKGEFGPVDIGVWEYEVSGLKVVQSWLGYRMRQRKGKKSSPLDEITPAEWTGEYTSEFLQLLNLLTRTLALHPKQAALLEAVLNGPLLLADELPPVRPQWRKAPISNGAQDKLDL